MRLSRSVALVVLSIVLPQIAHSQYHWHVVLPAKVDSTDYFYNSLTSYGNSFLAIGGLWPGGNNADTFYVIRSDDGGKSWTRFLLPDPTNGQYYPIVQAKMLDSLNVIAIAPTRFFRSTDGGRTWTITVGPANWGINAVANTGFDFINTQEGVVTSDFREVYATSDGGSHWDSTSVPNAGMRSHAYGGGKFRIMTSSFVIYTTYDYWKTKTQSYMNAIPGPKQDTSLHFHWFDFWGGDTIVGYGDRWQDSINRSTAIFLSTDLGLHWTELPIAGKFQGDPYCASRIGDTLVIGEYPQTIFLRSNNNGASWVADTIDSEIPIQPGVSYITQIATNRNGDVVGVLQVEDTEFFMGKMQPMHIQYLVRLEQGHSEVKIVSTKSDDRWLYPIPATNTLHVRELDPSLQIFDAFGRLYDCPNREGSIDISKLPAGAYFIRARTHFARILKE